MIILTIRTDKPEAEVGIYKDNIRVVYETWPAHRQLAETIHIKIEALLKSQKLDWSDVQGIVCFKGPGSFTGLRIGFSVANALAYGLQVPVVSSSGSDWIKQGIKQIGTTKNPEIALPDYGGEVFTTTPKK